jgi:hypothetical protein
MHQENQSKVNIFVPSETGALKTVLMRLAAPVHTIGSISALFERGVMYQMLSNSFLPYQVERVQTQQLKLKSTLEAHGARVILEPPLSNSTVHPRHRIFHRRCVFRRTHGHSLP